MQSMLHTLNRNFAGEEGLFRVSSGQSAPPIAIRVDEPIVVVRVDIGKLPQDAGKHTALFRKLLELNSSDLMHAAYGLEGDDIVLTAGLELDNLDANELAATLSDIDLALARHVAELHELAGD